MIAERLEVNAKRDFQKLFFAAGKRIYLSSLSYHLSSSLSFISIKQQSGERKPGLSSPQMK